MVKQPNTPEVFLSYIKYNTKNMYMSTSCNSIEEKNNSSSSEATKKRFRVSFPPFSSDGSALTPPLRILLPSSFLLPLATSPALL